MCGISVLHHNITGEVTQSMNNFEQVAKFDAEMSILQGRKSEHVQELIVASIPLL